LKKDEIFEKKIETWLKEKRRVFVVFYYVFDWDFWGKDLCEVGFGYCVVGWRVWGMRFIEDKRGAHGYGDCIKDKLWVIKR
jgi:hypothetical protein